MKTPAYLLTLTASAVLSLSTALAHDGDEPHSHHSLVTERRWTLSETGESWTGQFVSAKDGRVRIRRSDGWIRPVEVRRLSAEDQEWVSSRMENIQMLNHPQYVLTSQQAATDRKSANNSASTDVSLLRKSFEPFRTAVKTRSDADYFYIESSGIPDHTMMVGITAWQQQVPFPQKYTGENAWRLPLHPVPAQNPLSAKTGFFRGAIAIAANGIPIFNPIKNDGRTDTLLAGELDDFGGHCGRADDYHYHIAPVHLTKLTGNDVPIAWALDGYPIYTFQDERAPDYAPLDQWNGHKDARGNYHYHATKNYPYLNGGFYGEVVERDGQVDPQPRAESPRPALPPLAGAKIVGFETAKPGSHILTYEIRGRKGTVSYLISDNGSAKFTFTTPEGKTTTEEYAARSARGGRGGPPRNERPEGERKGQGQKKGQGQRKGQGPPAEGNRPPQNGKRPPRDDNPPPRKDGEGPQAGGRGPRGTPEGKAAVAHRKIGDMTLSSSSIGRDRMLSVDCTCDGNGESPAIAWNSIPEGTKSLAVSLWHTAPDQEKSYWVVYNIPASVSGLKQNQKGTGTTGSNDRKQTEFDPMCSQGPGVKTYHITVFALSEELKLSPRQATRAALLDAVKNITLAETTLDFDYQRDGQR